jgi:hypothetical protein
MANLIDGLFLIVEFNQAVTFPGVSQLDKTGDIMDRNSFGRSPLRGTMMGMSVDDDVDALAVEGIPQALRPEKRVQFERFASQRVFYRGVMKDSHFIFAV